MDKVYRDVKLQCKLFVLKQTFAGYLLRKMSLNVKLYVTYTF
ncbi:hypothetical protein QFZ20_001603 [Flavobacterium sp. W4I14]|nr:hypothetical protein [Flavobacterium sp. W4I14]